MKYTFRRRETAVGCRLLASPIFIFLDLILDGGNSILHRISRMDNDRKIAANRDFYLRSKHPLLFVFRRRIVVIIETDFTDGDNFFMLAEFFNFPERI